MALFDIYGYSRETQDKFVDYYTVGPRAGNIPLEGVFAFTNRDEDDYIYVAYKTFPGEGQLDGQNRLVSFCFDEEDKEKGEFATFSHNGYGYDDPGVSRLSKSKTSCPVDSTEWRDAILENLLGELHHLSINYSNWHEFSPFAIEGAKVAPLSAFDPQVEENLESRYLRPKKGDDEPGKDSDYNRLVAACKKESKLSEFNKIMNRLAKDFSLDKPLNIKLIEYMDDGVKRPYGVAYFYDGFTVVFEKGDYSRHSDWYIEKNTPYGIKHQELNVGKRFDSGWSPSSLTMESYENYFKPFFAKWLDRIQDKWRISLDDDTEEAVAEVLGENTLIRRKINESAEKKYVIYEDAPDFDGYLSPYGELVGYPEDAEVFDSVDEAKEELVGIIDNIEMWVDEGEDSSDYSIKICEYNPESEEVVGDVVELNGLDKIRAYYEGKSTDEYTIFESVPEYSGYLTEDGELASEEDAIVLDNLDDVQGEVAGILDYIEMCIDEGDDPEDFEVIIYKNGKVFKELNGTNEIADFVNS